MQARAEALHMASDSQRHRGSEVLQGCQHCCWRSVQILQDWINHAVGNVAMILSGAQLSTALN